MRLNEDHAYDDRVLDPNQVKERLIPEYIFRHFIRNIAKKQGQITGFHWLIALVSRLFPEEFSPERTKALELLSYKVYVAYYEEPPTHTLCIIMKQQGISPQVISEKLGIRRENVYYYLKKDIVMPSQCMLTYGEYNLMLDFMDAWNQLTQMGGLAYGTHA